MYLNKNNSTAAQFNKGNQGEQIYEQWLIDHEIPYRRATKEEDYQLKHDFYITTDKEYSIAVKSNYSAKWDTIVIELEQLAGKEFPPAWIDHEVDYFAFIVKNDVYTIAQSVLKDFMKHNSWKYRTYDRAQGRFKGEYRILFLPLEEFKEIANHE